MWQCTDVGLIAPDKVRPKKTYGQNFLANTGTISRVVNAILDTRPKGILEIGAGRGEITIPLALQVQEIVAVEIDTGLCSILKDRLKGLGLSHVEVINGDIMEMELEGVIKEGFSVVGNLPYYISTQILFKLEGYRSRIDKGIFMLQREVAERICAGPGDSCYSSLSLLIQYESTPKLLFHLKPSAFWPRPKVG